MEEQIKKRTRRTPQQRAEALDAKIQKLNQDLESVAAKRAEANEEFDKKEVSIQARIKAVEQKKRETLAPRTVRKTRKSKKQKIQEIIQIASKSGLKPEEIAQRLGLDQAED